MSARSRYAGAQPSRPGEGSVGRALPIEIQRWRIVMAMIEVAAEGGAANATVARVIARSGVSRRTFYELFVDTEDCLLAAMEESLECARQHVRQVYDSDKPWRARIRLALHALLRFADDEPAMGRLLVVETLGARAEVVERRLRVIAELTGAVDAGREESGRRSGITPLTAEGVVGSVLSVVYARMVKRERSPLVKLTNPLMSMIALPYMGATAARRELDRPLPRDERRQAQPPDGAGSLNGLPMRVTHRTIFVLSAIAAQPGASNRKVGESAGMTDQGQISKLLQRLERLGLIVNGGVARGRGLPNVWTLTPAGAQIEQAMSRSRNTDIDMFPRHGS